MRPQLVHIETWSTFSCRSNEPGTSKVRAAEGTGDCVAYCFQSRCAESLTPDTSPVSENAIPGNPSPSGSVAPGGSSGPSTGSDTEGRGASAARGGSVEGSVGRYAVVAPRTRYQRPSDTAQPPEDAADVPWRTPSVPVPSIGFS